MTGSFCVPSFCNRCEGMFFLHTDRVCFEETPTGIDDDNNNNNNNNKNNKNNNNNNNNN